MPYTIERARRFPIATNIAADTRVVLSGGNLVAAAAHEKELGTLSAEYQTTGAGATGYQSVIMRSAQGTVTMIASAAITQYAKVYGAASGKVSSTANGNFIGWALEAASADGDEIEVLRADEEGETSTVEAKTSDYTVTVNDTGKTFTTVGAAGAVTFAMPAAVVGLKYRFRVGAAQELRIDPNGSEVIALPSTGVAGAAGKYLTANADGETVEIECTKAGQWSVFGFTGTWTAEA